MFIKVRVGRRSQRLTDLTTYATFCGHYSLIVEDDAVGCRIDLKLHKYTCGQRLA